VDASAGVPAKAQRRGFELLGASSRDEDAVARAQQLLGGRVADSGAASADEGVASIDGSLLVNSVPALVATGLSWAV
jgi:hypothetical protein